MSAESSRRKRLRGWRWMLVHFGLRTTFWYWRQGRKRGWMTERQSERFFFEQFGLLPPWMYEDRL